ncbi:eukaryotic aspartyl protease protein [Rutstroemia sp. NJR-2017a WRK4]|nr:eukaryotic aspartyl protease protein [Rutstroemia sp. NJR-2017a WRK4]
MRTSTIIVAAVGILSGCTEAIQLQRRTDGPPRVVGFDVERRAVSNPLKRDRIRRRSNTVTATLDNEETLYFANGTLGTPAQSLRLHIDTGSSDLWVNTPSSALCSEKGSPSQMVADKLINSNAYSLWLNDLDASTGSILFGGVDTAQYHGQLETLPIQKESGYYAEFLITLTEVTLGSSVIAKNQALAVLLDSGSSLTYLPDAMTEAIYEVVGAQYDSSEGAAYVPCSLASNSSTLNFTFTSPTISVDMNELVIPVTSSSGRPLQFTDGTSACLFGIAPAGDSTSVLGDTFLRSAYVVYDLDNNEISLAQTNFNATSTSVVEITSGTTAVPDATLVANAASATAGSQSGGTIGGTVSLGTGSKSSSAATQTPPPMLLGGMAALGAGIYYAM